MPDIEEIRKKIDRLITEKGMNYRHVSHLIGRKDSYIQQYVKYRYPRRLKEIDRMRLAKLLGVDDSELMDNEIIASKTVGTPSANMTMIADIIDATSSPEGELTTIEVLSSQAPNKDGSGWDKPIGRILMCKQILEDLTTTAAEHIKVVKINNESMAPTICSGDILWFDSTYAYPEADGLYLIGAGRELIVRRVQISPLDGTVIISSDSAAYQAFQAKSAKEVKVLGKVVSVTHKL